MAVQLVDVVPNLYNGAAEPITAGSATIRPSVELQDIPGEMEITQGPLQFPFTPPGCRSRR
jgi:hypothetical protein